MSVQQSELGSDRAGSGRDPAQAHRQAVAAVGQLPGSGREKYEGSRSLVEAFWPELSEFQIAWTARVASDLGLDLLLGEIIWYQGRPYVTNRGLVRLLNRHPQFDNYELEPASEELRRAMRVKRDEEQVWVCRLWRKDRTRPAVGYGRATPEDTLVGYGQAQGDAQDQESLFRTPAVAEMAQERAMRRATQGGFAWEPVSASWASPGQAGEGGLGVSPEDGDISPRTGDGGDDIMGSTLSQPRCIPAVAQERLETEGPEGSQEKERRELWRRMEELLAALPRDTPKQVCSWFRREHGVEVKGEELAAKRPPARVSTLALRRLVQGLEGYLTKLSPQT